MFDGYRDNPEANAAAFTADGWFRTGDLGRLDTDGFLHVTGRSKEMIVLGGGKNVMPEEVEAAYAAHPAIREIAVLERAGALVAVVLPDLAALRASGMARPEDVLRVALTAAAQDLPSYQRLAGYVLAREPLPRTRLGKVQRFRLPALYDDLLAGRAPQAAAPLSEADAALVAMPGAREVWDILKARYAGKPLSPDASPSLDLGIDSLEWVSLAMEIEARTGLRLTEDEMADMASVRALLLRATDGAPAPPARDPAALAAEVAAATTPPSPLVFPLRVAGWALARGIGRVMFDLRATGADGVPREGPFVIVANHVSDLDPGLVAAALPFGAARRLWWSGAAERLFVNGAARAFCSHLPGVSGGRTRARPGDRDGARGAGARARGWSGSRNPGDRPDGQLQRFLPGIGLVLDGMPEVTVIPAHISGAFEAMPRDARLPRRHPVRIAFGAPVKAAALASDATDPRQRAEHIAEAAARPGRRGRTDAGAFHRHPVGRRPGDVARPAPCRPSPTAGNRSSLPPKKKRHRRKPWPSPASARRAARSCLAAAALLAAPRPRAPPGRTGRSAWSSPMAAAGRPTSSPASRPRRWRSGSASRCCRTTGPAARATSRPRRSRARPPMATRCWSRRMGTNSGLNALLYRNLGYDSARDFAPVGMFCTTSNLLIVHNSVPGRNFTEVVAWIRANPGKFNFASAGVGAITHLIMEDVGARLNLDMVHVPYRQTTNAMTDLIAGRRAGALPRPAGRRGAALAPRPCAPWPSPPPARAPNGPACRR